MTAPLILAVAPNGARRGLADHPALPITADQIARDARACLEAGAAMLHLHVRDAQGRHSLSSDHYLAATAAVRRAVGRDLLIQITTEAGGRYCPAEQIAAVRALAPEAVSLAIRELAPVGDQRAEADLATFLDWLRNAGARPQFILYDSDDARRFERLSAQGVIPGAGHAVLRVYGKPGAAHERPVEPLADSPCRGAWMLCGFGTLEWACVEVAVAEGGHARVGFENNLELPDGRVAPENAALVAAARRIAEAGGRPLADAEQARALLESCC